MRRPATFLTSLVLCLVMSPLVRAADGDPPAPARPLWGTLVKVGSNSIVVMPTLVVGVDGEANEQTIPVAAGKTEVIFADLVASRTTKAGATVRMFSSKEKAALTDLKVGMPVEVTTADGAATRIIAIWSVTGKVIKVEANAMTFRPQKQAGAQDPAKKDAADGDVKVTIVPDKTKVLFLKLMNERAGRDGKVVSTYAYEDASQAQLKEGQTVAVYTKDGVAARIVINPPKIEQ